MIGQAGNTRVKHIILDGNGQDEINEWLTNHPDTEVIDIKFTSSATSRQYNEYESEELWTSEVLIVYRI